MKIIVLALALSLAACDSSSGGKSSDSSPPIIPGIGNQKPEPQPTPDLDPEPDTKDKDEIISKYKPDFFYPLYVEMNRVKSSELEYIEDYLSYQQGIAINWENSREGGFVPEKYLSLWDSKNVKYIDNSGIKGIEKLETIRNAMLEKCPVLAEPQYNSPVEIHWGKRDDKIGGLFRSFEVLLSKDFETKETRHYGGVYPEISNNIWIYGKNKLWDYPNQTSKESENPWGIDRTFVHEWGHHLMFSIDVNLGRNSHTTWEMSESFAESLRFVCAGSFLDNPKIVESDYEDLTTEPFRQWRINSLARKTVAYKGGEYNLRSMEYCIAHEKYLEKFDPNAFATALIDAYKCTQGKKPQEGIYPITFDDGSFAQAPWVSAGYYDDESLNKKPPLLVTREEFLGCFRQHYDCGLANDLIDADIEGKSKFEW